VIDSLYIAATGMGAQQTNVDTIANNLANLNTTGFKAARVNFQDLVYRQMSRLLGARQSGLASLAGLGVNVVGIGKTFAQGNLQQTGQPFDLAINGAGFFEVTQTDGTRAYTRTGSLQVNKDGAIATADGYALNPELLIPADATATTIDSSGQVSVTVQGETTPVQVGKITLAQFVNPTGLKPVGNNLYVPTEGSGDAFYGDPGSTSFGTIQQGFLEASNVSLVGEFTNLIVAQRAYEANSKAVQASDEMLGIINALRR
jgi:flagellar basal-body rod protein FlgG